MATVKHFGLSKLYLMITKLCLLTRKNARSLCRMKIPHFRWILRPFQYRSHRLVDYFRIDIGKPLAVPFLNCQRMINIDLKSGFP